jgi:hypothetical protein
MRLQFDSIAAHRRCILGSFEGNAMGERVTEFIVEAAIMSGGTLPVALLALALLLD